MGLYRKRAFLPVCVRNALFRSWRKKQEKRPDHLRGRKAESVEKRNEGKEKEWFILSSLSKGSEQLLTRKRACLLCLFPHVLTLFLDLPPCREHPGPRPEVLWPPSVVLPWRGGIPPQASVMEITG